jgi:hypothetical protein
MEQNTKISFIAKTIDWTFGAILSVHVKANRDCSFYVAWGDGKTTAYIGKGTSEGLWHDYFPKTDVPEGGILFYVDIFTDDSNCRITELNLSTVEMCITDLNVHNAELEVLVYNMTYEPMTLDVSRNTELKYLDCGSAKLSSLDVSNNAKLTELYCQNNNLTTLDLSNNLALRILNCENNGLYNLLLWYCPQLTEATFEKGNYLSDSTIISITEILDANNSCK